MWAGSPGLIAGPQRLSACFKSSPLGVTTPCFNCNPFVPIGKAVRAYTSWVSKSRMTGRLHALRPALPVLLALGHDGGTQPRAEIFGQFVELGVAINLDGLLRGVTNHIAVVAPGKMVLQLDLCSLVEHPVQIIR